MISKEFVYDRILPLVQEKSRMIDFYLIKSLFENQDDNIIAELKKYQNKDFGFGNGLEPDVQMPNSSVVATNMAIKALDFIYNPEKKTEMVKDIISYYENVYNIKDNRFYMVDENVDNYPHAVWWNYADTKKNFPFGNPDPEVIGFLFENRKFLTKLNFSKLINDVVDFIMSKQFLVSGMHTLMSVIEFYKRVDDDVKNLIHDRIHVLVKKEIDAGIGKWEEYALEPYKIYIQEPHFINTHLEELGLNLKQVMDKVTALNVEPNWQWYQYEKEFEEVKHQWTGHIYFEMILALRMHRMI